MSFYKTLILVLSIAGSSQAFAQYGNNPYQNPYNNPYNQQSDIVADFMSGRMQNCYITDTNGYHQVYINGNFSGNYVPGSDDIRLRQALQNYVYNGTCRYQPYQIDRAQLLSYYQGNLDNCIVKDTNGYHQIYINGTFSGNYAIGSDDIRFYQALQNNLDNHTCRFSNFGMSNAELLNLYTSGKLANCYVVPKDGYNQVYIDGNFSGNYEPGTGDYALYQVLRNYLTTGRCHGYAAPNPYPSYPAPQPYPAPAPAPRPGIGIDVIIGGGHHHHH